AAGVGTGVDDGAVGPVRGVRAGGLPALGDRQVDDGCAGISVVDQGFLDVVVGDVGRDRRVRSARVLVARGDLRRGRRLLAGRRGRCGRGGAGRLRRRGATDDFRLAT